MQYELHIIQLPTTKSLQKGKNLQFAWCLQTSCTHSQQRGKALCLFLEDLHRNGVGTSLSGSVPHLQLARPQLKGLLDPLQPCNSLPVKLAHRDASSCLVKQPCLLIPTTREATASPQPSDEVLTIEEDFSVLSRSTVQAFPTALPVLPISVTHSHTTQQGIIRY